MKADKKTQTEIKRFKDERFVVTTANRPKKREVLKAIKLADELNTAYISRRSFSRFQENNILDFYYVVESERMIIRWNGGEFFFHPASSKMRMRNIKNNQRDHLIEILDLKGDEIIFDLTLGLGSEAILMAAFLNQGRVIGVEASKHIYTIVKYGFRDYQDQSPWVNESFNRIKLINEDYKTWIRQQEDDSADYVYCDPMFDNPVMTSSGFNPLRPFAVYDKIEQADIIEMKRVAKKAVILKTLKSDSLLNEIKTDEIRGSQSSGVLYGVIHC